MQQEEHIYFSLEYLRFALIIRSKISKLYHPKDVSFRYDHTVLLIVGTKLFRHFLGIPMGTNCAPLVADLFLFCYERNFMMSLSGDKQASFFDAFNIISRYLNDILNINTIYFDNMVRKLYPSELQRNKAITSDTEASFSVLALIISNDIVATKIYTKREDLKFLIVNFFFLR